MMIELMQQAFDIARFSVGYSHPNPSVGAIIINNNNDIIGVGFTNKTGQDHAEIIAIKNTIKNYGIESLKNATLLVTLEPCSHYGKTPPCVESIVRYGISKVIIATIDFSGKVNGKGIQFLKDNGITVEILDSSLFDTEKYFTLNPFFYKEKYNKPKIYLKWAQTKEGWLAPINNTSGSISSLLSKEILHRLRKIFTAVITTPGTIIYDKPMLNSRIHKSKIFEDKSSSYLKKIISMFEEEDFLESIDVNHIKNEILNQQNSRYFILPKINYLWNKKDLLNFIHFQSNIEGFFFCFASDDETSILLKDQNINFKIIDNFYNFNSILEQVGQDGHNQCFIESGPKYLEFLYQNKYYNGLLIFESQLQATWTNGRGFSLSNNLANDQILINNTFTLRDKIHLDTDIFYHYSTI